MPHLELGLVVTLQKMDEPRDDSLRDDLLYRWVALCTVARCEIKAVGRRQIGRFARTRTRHGSPMDKSFLNCVVASSCWNGSSLYTPWTIAGKLSSCSGRPNQATPASNHGASVQHSTSGKALTLCCTTTVARSLFDSSMPPAAAPMNVARFFCKLSSRLVLRSSMILSSRFLRASSASITFLKPFLRRSATVPALALIVTPLFCK